MKKRMILCMTALLCAAGLVVGLNNQSAEAAKKKSVKARVKGSTLTISGKGDMPASLRIKKKKIKKIKKVVIKKGITSIPIDAFIKYKKVQEITVPVSVKTIGQDAFSCKNLKKLTIPGKFKVRTYYGEKGDDAYRRIARKVKTVLFNSNLSLKTAAYFRAENLIVSKKDSKYKSIDGVVYTKNGKELVRVPFQRTELNIVEGCEIFCLQAVMYGNVDAESDTSEGCDVKKITIPASVKRVDADKYYAITDGGLSDIIPGYEYVAENLKIIAKSKQLDGQSFSELIYRLGMGIEDLMKQVPGQISYVNNMYVTSDHVLLKYNGKNSVVTIPSHIKKVGDYAFFDNKKITKLILEPGVEEIGKGSFSRCSPIFGKKNETLDVQFPNTLQKIGEGAFSSNVIRKIDLPLSVKDYGKRVFESNEIRELVLPATMKIVPEKFVEANRIEKLVIPDMVEKIQKEAFANNPIKTLVIGKRVTEIGESAFVNNKAQKILVPASVKKIASDSFGGEKLSGVVEIQGSSKGISSQAFSTTGGILVYAQGAREKKTSISVPSAEFFYGEKVKVELNWSKVKGVSGYEAVFSTNKKFTKNKKKVKLKANQTRKKMTVKVKIKKDSHLYVRIRPYTMEKGKKVCGRWAEDII